LLRERLALKAALEDKPVDDVVLRDVYAQKYRQAQLAFHPPHLLAVLPCVIQRQEPRAWAVDAWRRFQRAVCVADG
jgi:hypothetical protein